jgi:hypothetical protein
MGFKKLTDWKKFLSQQNHKENTMSEQARQLTVNDLIQSDPRTKALQDEYKIYAQEKNDRILVISHNEEMIIHIGGQITYVEGLIADEAGQPTPNQEILTYLGTEKSRLIQNQHAFIVAKAEDIKFIADRDTKMQGCTDRYNALAETIISELKARAAQMQAGIGESGMSAPESAPDVITPESTEV